MTNKNKDQDNAMTKTTKNTLLMGALLIGSALISPSQAEASAWMVKKVSKASAPYCAMIKRYSNDRVLSFAQRNSAQISTAIDFGDKFLDKGRAYSVTLSDGDGFSRRFEVKPASSSAIVIKLNSKDPILERVASKGDLTVNIAGVLSTFNVSDLDQGLEKLENCQLGEPLKTASVSSGAASLSADSLANIAPAAGDTTASHSLYSKAANAKITELEAKNKDLMSTISAHEKMVTSLENQLRETENAGKGLQTDLKGQVAALTTQIEQQSFEMSQLKAQLSQNAEKIAYYQGMETKLSAAEANLAAAMERNNGLTAQITTLEGDSLKLGSHEATITQLQAENQKLSAQLIDLEQTKVIESQNIKTQQGAQISNLHKQLQNAQMTISSLEQAMATIETAAGDKMMVEQGAYDALQADYQVLAGEKDALQAQLSKLSREMEMDNSDITMARLEKALDETNRALSRAGKENAELYQKYVQLQKDLEEAQLAKAEDKSWDAEKATARYNEAQREIRRLAMHVQNSKKQCDLEKKEIESLLFDPKITAKEQQDKLAKLENEINQLNVSATSCQAQLASVMEENQAMMAMAKAPEPKAEIETEAVAMADVTPAAGAVMPAVIQETTEQAKDYSVELVNILQTANVPLTQELNMLESGFTPKGASFEQGYSWTSDNITGRYERFNTENGSFAGLMNAYNDILSAQCGGDFAVMPSKGNTDMFAASDVACVNGDFGTSTSIVYTYSDGVFEVYSLNGDVTNMADLMESREQLGSSVKGTL